MPEALNAPLDEIPDLYLDLDDAVRELALAHEIDAYLHVEIRNSIYRSEEASRELLRRVDETPATDSISEIVYSSRRPLFFLTELSRAAVLRSPDTQLWKQLGDLIGEWMEILNTTDLEAMWPWRNVEVFLGHLDDESIRERLQTVADYWRKTVADHWRNLQQLEEKPPTGVEGQGSGVSKQEAAGSTQSAPFADSLASRSDPVPDSGKPSDKNKTPEKPAQTQQLLDESINIMEFHKRVYDVKRRVGDVDASFLSSQRGETAGGPLLIVDQVNKQFTFLGQIFRFDEFKRHSQAGLKCFLFLAKNPQVWHLRSAIVLGAEIDVNPEQLSADISSFRSVVKPAIVQYGQHLAGPRRREVDAAFIVANRTPMHTSGTRAAYKLAIDAAQIEFRGQSFVSGNLKLTEARGEVAVLGQCTSQGAPVAATSSVELCPTLPESPATELKVSQDDAISPPPVGPPGKSPSSG